MQGLERELICRGEQEEVSRWLKRYNLARLMDEQNWSRRDLADRYGCTEDYIWQLLKGKVGIGPEAIKKFSEVFKVPDRIYAPAPPSWRT